MGLQRVFRICSAVIFMSLTSAWALAGSNGLSTQGNGLIPNLASQGDPESDTFASGSLNGLGTRADGSANVGTWILNTTVSDTDFSNDGLLVGPEGVQYTMINNVQGSDDVNNITFTAVLPEGAPLISISQSPYFNSDFTWNGGNAEASQMRLFWADGGAATMIDPDDQLVGLDGSQFVSGDTIQLNQQIYNNIDSWRIDLPVGVDSVRVGWSSASPTADSDLTREWITFHVDCVTVPEASSLGLAFTALVGLCRLGRRRYQ